MKVFEKINELKGTKATIQQITNWSLMNKVCPVEFDSELELDCEYPEELDKLAHEYCNGKCNFHCCLEKFLDHDLAKQSVRVD